MPHALLHEIFTSASLALPPTANEGHIVVGGTHYFAKTSAHASAKQVRAEAASLAAMARTAPAGLVPRILGYRERDGVVALVTGYAGGRRGDMRLLGERLAKMHIPPPREEGEQEQEQEQEDMTRPPTMYTGEYGFPVPTFCGATEQDNTWTVSWEDFFRDRRLGSLVERIGEGRVTAMWKKMLHRAVPLLLRDFSPAPVPVPLHGDLWPGNLASDSHGPVIFDPAGYYGHGEADLGMTRMFGGFTKEFYDAYHAIHPRSEPYHEQRIRLYELYHHLNHALIFGGSYTSSALGIMRELVEWADGVDAAVETDTGKEK